MKTSHRTIVNDYKNHDQIKSLDELKYSQPALVTTSALLSNNFYPAISTFAVQIYYMNKFLLYSY